MKTLLSLLLLFLSFTAAAQQLPPSDTTGSRTFVGVGLSTTAYQVMGKPKYVVINSVIPFGTFYYGYRLSKRATIQAGLGYGMNEVGGAHLRYVSADSIYSAVSDQFTQAVVVPVTFRFTPFNPYKRLQLYGHASIVPVLGHIKARASESLHSYGPSTPLYDEEMYSITMIATAGLTLNYKISKRLDGYLDGILFYKNFSFERPARRFYENKSIGLGINYNLY